MKSWQLGKGCHGSWVSELTKLDKYTNGANTQASEVIDHKQI